MSVTKQNSAPRTNLAGQNGDAPADEVGEMVRVTKAGGTVIFCPGIVDRDCAEHDYLMAQGFAWSRFEEPGDGIRRKYWKQV